MTNDLAACCLITNHLATVLWLLSGMASSFTSQMASSSIRRRGDVAIQHTRHCEKRSDVAIQNNKPLDCFISFAMTAP